MAEEQSRFIPRQPSAEVKRFVTENPQARWTDALGFVLDNYPRKEGEQVTWLVEGGASKHLLWSEPFPPDQKASQDICEEKMYTLRKSTAREKIDGRKGSLHYNTSTAMLNRHRQDSLLSPLSPFLKKKASASADPFVSLFLQLFVLLALTLLLLPFAILIQMHLSSLLVYLLFVVTAITGLRGRHSLPSKGITLLFGIAGIHVLADWLSALSSEHPFGIALYAYLTVFVVFGSLALFWWVAYRFLLRASSPYRSSHAPSPSHKPRRDRGNQ